MSSILNLLMVGGAVLAGIPTWHDGDSGRLGRACIRLSAIEAGELPGSPKYERNPDIGGCSAVAGSMPAPARERLRALTIHGLVCRIIEEDAYDRSVVVCRLADGRDPAAVLLREGLARPDLRY